jgi:hypothetical protein
MNVSAQYYYYCSLPSIVICSFSYVISIVLSSLLGRVFGSQTVEQHKENSYAKEFGIEVKEQLLSLDARVLPPPWVNVSVRGLHMLISRFYCTFLFPQVCLYIMHQLKFHGNGMTEEFLPRAGRWNMIRKVCN